MDIVEKITQMMSRCGLATGHGDAIDDLLDEKNKEIERLQEQAHYHYENGLKKDVEIERLKDEVKQLVKERNRYKRVCLKIVGDSKEESDISDFVLYLAKEALKESE